MCIIVISKLCCWNLVCKWRLRDEKPKKKALALHLVVVLSNCMKEVIPGRFVKFLFLLPWQLSVLARSFRIRVAFFGLILTSSLVPPGVQESSLRGHLITTVLSSRLFWKKGNKYLRIFCLLQQGYGIDLLMSGALNVWGPENKRAVAK
jgi:hypothetical protein